MALVYNKIGWPSFLPALPKSGTTWLKALLYSLINRAIHSPVGLDHPLLKSNPHDLVPFLELNVYVDRHFIPDIAALPSPRISATHLPIGSLPLSILETGKVVYLCRDSKDTFISLWHFVNKVSPHHEGNKLLEEAFDKFYSGVCFYGPFWDHVLGYWKYSLQNPNKVLFIKYEDLKENPIEHLKRLADFCGCPFSKDEENLGIVEEIIKLCNFDNLSNLEVNKDGKILCGIENNNFFRKGEVGDWTNYLSSEMAKKIDLMNEEKISPWGLFL